MNFSGLCISRRGNCHKLSQVGKVGRGVSERRASLLICWQAGVRGALWEPRQAVIASALHIWHTNYVWDGLMASHWTPVRNAADKLRWRERERAGGTVGERESQREGERGRVVVVVVVSEWY